MFPGNYRRLKMAKRSNNLVGVTGEYFVCAELGKRGILALLTPKKNHYLM